MSDKDKLEQFNIQMPHGRIPKEILTEIWAIWNDDEDSELALKVALAAIEYSLCGNTNFNNDRRVMRTLNREIDKLDHNLDSYNMECELKVIEKRLDEIARLYLQEKKTQKDIAAALNITQGEVSKRWKTIQTQYPELIQKYSDI